MKTYLQPGIATGDRIIIEAETELDRLVLPRILPVLIGFCKAERFQVEAAAALEVQDKRLITSDTPHEFVPLRGTENFCDVCGLRSGALCHIGTSASNALPVRRLGIK